MEDQKGKQKGGTMRLGSYPCRLQKNSLSLQVYGKNLITERHRHRYEFNNQYKQLFEKHGMAMSGICEERDLVEMIELKDDHPWFIGVQFHPEFKSKPLQPHPLFKSFVAAALEYSNKKSNMKEQKEHNESRTSKPGKSTRNTKRATLSDA